MSKNSGLWCVIRSHAEYHRVYATHPKITHPHFTSCRSQNKLFALLELFVVTHVSVLRSRSRSAFVANMSCVHRKLVCHCTNGKPMSGTDCKSDGGSKCEGCNSGFKLRPDKTACDGRLLEQDVLVVELYLQQWTG